MIPPLNIARFKRGTMRFCNPVKQGYDHDSEWIFVRTHVPELEIVPSAFIHEPWRRDGAADLRYPAPIVDNVTAAKAARAALRAIRKSANHKADARKIVAKHGSRKADIKMTGQQPRAKIEPAGSGQLVLDL